MNLFAEIEKDSLDEQRRSDLDAADSLKALYLFINKYNEITNEEGKILVDKGNKIDGVPAFRLEYIRKLLKYKNINRYDLIDLIPLKNTDIGSIFVLYADNDSLPINNLTEVAIKNYDNLHDADKTKQHIISYLGWLADIAAPYLKTEISKRIGKYCYAVDDIQLFINKAKNLSKENIELIVNSYFDKFFELFKSVPLETNQYKEILKFRFIPEANIQKVLYELLSGNYELYSVINFYKAFNENYFNNEIAILYIKVYIKQNLRESDILRELEQNFKIPEELILQAYLVAINYESGDLFEYLKRKNGNIEDKSLTILINYILTGDVEDINSTLDFILNIFPNKTKQIQFLASKQFNRTDVQETVEDVKYKEKTIFFEYIHSTSADIDYKDNFEKNFHGIAEAAATKKDLTTILILEKALNDTNVTAFKFLLQILQEYCNVKKKTFADIYNEVIKKRPTILTKLVNNFNRDYGQEIIDVLKSISFSFIANSSSNFEEYLKYLDRLYILVKELHNDKNLSISTIRDILFNKAIDINKDYIKQFIKVSSFLASLRNYNEINILIDEVLEINPKLINKDIFNAALQKFIQLKKDIHRGGHDKDFKTVINRETLDLLIYLSTEINKIKNISILKKYYKKAKPKDENLFKLDLSFQMDGLEAIYDFKVLDFLDPYAFSVGVDTDCCQRIGGAGEAAAVDSFINPLAGVLVLYKDGILLSQSYFHFVPEDNGFILDNIEANIKNLKNIGFDVNNDESFALTNLYMQYAELLKKKFPDIKYIKVGLAYSKINDDLFERIKEKKDPRHFEVEGRPYSDYRKKKHIDLLIPKAKQAKSIYEMIKIAGLFNNYVMTDYFRANHLF